MMDDRLQRIMIAANAALEPYGLTLADPGLGWRVWHLYYYDPETKNCFPVLRQRDASDAAPTCLADLVQGFDPETPAASILQWASTNGVLDD